MTAGLEPPFHTLDPSGMGRLIEAAPDQIDQALASEPWPVLRSPDLLAVGAMGGSAIAADLCACLFGSELPRPMLTVRGYRWPACVTHASLALLASYSGRTEETLALDDEARARGVSRLGLSTGGELGTRWSSDGVAWRALPSGMPPRAALYASWLAVTRLLGSLGWLSDPDAMWREAAGSLRARASSWGLSAAESGNPAKRLARELIGRPIVIYAESRLEPIATRWRNQINENAKLLGHSSAIPELNHNEVVGWERAGDPARGAVVVILRDGLEAEPNVARLALTAEFLGRQGVRVLEPEPPAGGALARAVTLAWLGDLVSFYLAMLNGVDPTPVAALDEFKRRLSERRVAARGRA